MRMNEEIEEFSSEMEKEIIGSCEAKKQRQRTLEETLQKLEPQSKNKRVSSDQAQDNVFVSALTKTYPKFAGEG